ncbi:hypothetical protein [Methylobacterium sp. Leaf108]|uniref:hypothetical protein n=1 Tax=Methylobacterium sp. Leaf108 TaxID=1736256 RepID=UPI0006FB9CD1|nr:hypothetical protein [Methylobacterium sp. Leaf108]KQP61066.1 hypothetical protein ASF39_15435 [Methylobacterium sp. Leaf108]
MPDRLVQQGLRVPQAQQDLAAQTVLLALAAQMAWLDLWVRPALPEQLERQARTARLVRRGIPEPLARQALRVL